MFLCLNFTLHPLFHCSVDMNPNVPTYSKVSSGTVGACEVSFSLSVNGANIDLAKLASLDSLFHTQGLWEFDFSV